MAVAHSAASESHTGTTGSTNQASFSWTHTQTGTPQGVVVFVSTYASVSDFITSVTYGGIALTRLTGGLAQDGAGESGRLDTFFLGSGLSSGNQTITVNRTNNATVMYAAAATVTAGADTAVPTATIVLLEGDGTLTVQSVNDTSPGQNSVRYAGGYSGLQAPPSADASSTLLNSIDIGNYGSALVRETTAGQGARSVGFSAASDDRAVVHLAIRELVPRTETPIVGTFTLTGNAADLLHNVKLDGGTGAFTFTGNPATLTEATPKSITAETGTFALTGNDVTARHDVRIDGARGEFTLTGGSPTLAKITAKKLLPVVGAFSLTGNQSGIAHGVRIDGGTGAFTLTGNAATLTKTAADELSALVGTFTLASNGATLARSRLFTAIRGQFTLTGQSASLLQNYRVTGDRGQFLLAGNPAALAVAYTMLGARGAFTFTGNPAGLSDTDRLAAATGIFSLTGLSAGLVKSGGVGRRRNVLIF